MAQTNAVGVGTGGIVVAISTVVLVVATVLAWATASALGQTGSINGIDLFTDGSPIFNGVVTVLLGLVATVLVLAAPDNEGATIGAAVLGLLVLLIGLAFVAAPQTAYGDFLGGAVDFGLVETGIGVYLTILGGIGVLAGGVYSYAN